MRMFHRRRAARPRIVDLAEFREKQSLACFDAAIAAGLGEDVARRQQAELLKAFDSILGAAIDGAVDLEAVHGLTPAQRAELAPAIHGHLVRLVLGRYWGATLRELVRLHGEIAEARLTRGR